jgi:hypothetical protein
MKSSRFKLGTFHLGIHIVQLFGNGDQLHGAK